MDLQELLENKESGLEFEDLDSDEEDEDGDVYGSSEG